MTGDLYLDTTASVYYGPKTADGWGTPTSLVGPQGPAGSGGGATASVVRTSGRVGVDLWTSGAPATATATATCLPGEVMRGGGYRPYGLDEGSYVTVFASYPDGEGWTVQAWNGYDGESQIEAYVVCETTSS